MSKEYREETTRKYEERIESLLKTTPPFVRDFYEHMHNGKREITTQFAYVRDFILFLKYLQKSIPSLNGQSLKNIDIDVFNHLNVKDLNEYRSFLHDEEKLTNSSIKKKFAAISAFYKYAISCGDITNNPMTNFELPAVNSHRIIKLDSELSNRLLAGILTNDMFLKDDGFGERPVPMPEEVAVRREKTVLRNYAICCLFLGTGLRVSELVGLDLSDISFRQNAINIIAKGGDEIQVFFGDDVARALKTYIDGTHVNYDQFIAQYSNGKTVIDWCKVNLNKPDFSQRLKESFPHQSNDFYKDTSLLAQSMRRQGRNAFAKDKNNKAVFLSNQGKRMTVRMVEIMIKEMVKTYLPDYDDKELFSPHKLRATCATRILSQTGDIQLASTQLNHKGVAVTAAFYAELQKEKQKDIVKNLDINNW